MNEDQIETKVVGTISREALWEAIMRNDSRSLIGTAGDQHMKKMEGN